MKMNNMDKSIITVNIFGNEYTIKGVAKPEYIISLANYLNGKMNEVQETTGLKDAKKIAILAGINITDELFECRKLLKEHVPSEQLDEQMAAIRSRIEGLIGLIDKELLTGGQHKPVEPLPDIKETELNFENKPKDNQ